MVLIMDCPTRWNSCLSMLERLIELIPYIVNVASDASLSKSAVKSIRANSYSFDEISVLQVKVLKP